MINKINRDHTFSLRLTDAERVVLGKAAAECDLSLSTWARLVLLGATGSELGKQIKTAKGVHDRMKRRKS